MHTRLVLIGPYIHRCFASTSAFHPLPPVLPQGKHPSEQFDKQVIGNKLVAEMLTSLFGEPWSVEDVLEVGTRIICQERLFNAREGLTREHDTLPARLLKEPKPDGPTKGAVVPLEELKDSFYKAMGYDLLTGNPTDAILEDFEIGR